MDVRTGQVRSVSDGFAWVDVERQSGCGRCNDAGGCGRACERVSATYMIPVDTPVLPGQRVDVVVAESAPLTAALLSYGVALLALFAGVGVAVLLAGVSDAVVGAGAAAGLVLALGWLRLSSSRSRIMPSVRILPASSTASKS